MVAYVAQTIQAPQSRSLTVWAAILDAAEKLPSSSAALEAFAKMGRAGVSDAGLWKQLMAMATEARPAPDERKKFLLAVLTGLADAPHWQSSLWLTALAEARSLRRRTPAASF